jgi:mono/diheme cytochrome c family protein
MLQRLLIERMEHRILVGTLAFLGTMVLVGWIAINEGGRMASFERQFNARSIERGAALFAANCANCHGEDGRGNAGVAPGLNSPHLFGFNYFASIDAETTQLEAERGAEGTTTERVAEIDARLTELSSERAALEAQMQPAIDAGYLLQHPDRLRELGWGGGLRTFLTTTLVHGRPTSGQYWPSGNGMAAWSQRAGGPLRDDQIDDLVNYMINYDKGTNWTLEDLNAVRQYALVPLNPNLPLPGGAAEPPVGTDVAAILTSLEGVAGDPQAGADLYNGAYACAGCHAGGAVAPSTEGTWTRVNEVRLQDPALAGYTAEQYLVESIVAPNAYIAPNYPAGAMPANFGDRITTQQMADILAYIRSHDEPLQ